MQNIISSLDDNQTNIHKENTTNNQAITQKHGGVFTTRAKHRSLLKQINRPPKTQDNQEQTK